MSVEEVVFGDWLRNRTWATRHADALALAHRSALRVMPLWSVDMGNRPSEKGDAALSLLRSNLTSGAVLMSGTLEVKAAVRALANQVSFFAAFSSERAAASTARAAAFADDAAGFATSAIAAASEADFDAIWSEVSVDAQWIERGVDAISRSLWSTSAPAWFKNSDAAARAFWGLDPDTWSFWLRWWDGILAGRPLPDDLQLKVALIPEATWEAGPAAVAEAIRGIEARRALDIVIGQNPYAWRIVFDPRRQMFEAVAVEPRNLSEVVRSVGELIKDFNKRCQKLGVGNFGPSVKLAFDPVISFLRRDMRRHAASPLSLFKAIEAARREMQEIADKEHFAGESYLTRFFLGLQDCADDICVASPEIVEQLKAKAAVRYELFGMERRRATMLQVFGLHLDAEGMLKRVALDALRVIGDETASDSEKKEAWYFATAVLPRAARAYLEETLDKDEEVKPPSKVALTKRVVEAADALAKLDKGKDALQENIPQLTDWVKQIVDAFGNLPV